MLCPKCKKEVPEGTKFCPECGATIDDVNAAPIVNTVPDYVSAPAKVKKPIYKKWWFWVIIVIVLIALISAFGGGKKDDAAGTAAKTTSAANETAAVVTTAATTETTTAAQNRFKAGETLNAGDLAIKYESAEVWTGYDEWTGPSAGNKIIRLKYSIVNNGTTDRYISSYDFSCYADNKPGESYWSGENELPTDNLSGGRSAEGYVYFEVPENASAIEVEYETSFWTDQKAIFVVELG